MHRKVRGLVILLGLHNAFFEATARLLKNLFST